MKIDRLISIILILLEKEKISAAKLGKMFGVTTRTIYRDIETISLAGIPIVTYSGSSGGIGIMEKYKIDKKFFTVSDISTLLMGLGSIKTSLSEKEISGTLAKVKSLIPKEEHRNIELRSNQIAIDLTPWAGNKSLQVNLEKIKNAMDENRYISFAYYDLKGNRSKRETEPYQLVLKQGSWYLQAYCLDRKEFRVFKLLRMTELEVMNKIFMVREFKPKQLDGTGWIEDRLTEIKLLVDESLRERVVERSGENGVEKAENNKIQVKFPFVEDDMGYNILLSYGDKCECLEPERVRIELKRRIQSMLSIYL